VAAASSLSPASAAPCFLRLAGAALDDPSAIFLRRGARCFAVAGLSEGTADSTTSATASMLFSSTIFSLPLQPRHLSSGYSIVSTPWRPQQNGTWSQSLHHDWEPARSWMVAFGYLTHHIPLKFFTQIGSSHAIRPS